MTTPESHVSPYSGAWYPGRREQLEALIQDLTEESQRRTGPWLIPNPLAFVVPHAGLAYSGAVAAAAYRQIAAARPKRIILLGFSHRGGPRGIWLPWVRAIETPLGEVEIDIETVEALGGSSPFQICDEAEVCDHSVEIQLPLLKAALPDVLLAPVYVNSPGVEAVEEAARRLASYLGGESVLVASSDFTHFGRAFGYMPFPVDEMTGARVAELDDDVAEAAGSLDVGMFREAIRKRSATVCGADPISLLLATLRLYSGEAEIFQYRHDYRTSADLTGDFHHSVSYAALGYYPHTSFKVDGKAGRALLDAALKSLREWQATGVRRPFPAEDDSPAMESRLGVFVSLYVAGELRGCIGSLGGREELRYAVPELALSAALDDARFPELKPREQGIEVEISILTPMKRVRGPECVRAGIHGALLRRGMRQGLLLPQVASERGWDTPTFLAALTQKAGVDSRVWKDPDARLYVFRAQRLHG